MFNTIALLVIFLLFVLTAILALAETSMMRITKPKALSLLEHKKKGAKALVRLVEHPEGFLHPILFLVFICQTVAATLVGIVIAKALGGIATAVVTALEVVVVFVLAEAIPKNLAVNNSEKVALLLAPVIEIVSKFWPLAFAAKLIEKLSNFIVPTAQSKDKEITESELLAMADVAADQKVIETSERALIRSIIHFGDTLVKEVMTPRPEIVAVEQSISVLQAIDIALSKGYSRLPAYNDSLDDITGIVVLKDLVMAQREQKGDQPIKDFLREAHFVPETKKVAPLLRQMQEGSFQLAIVIDEYGGVSGIVTIEDLLEEVVGEIVDEFDKKEPQFEVLSPSEWSLSGRLSIELAKELTSIDFPEGDFDTIGGLLFHMLGHVPKEGESVYLDDSVLVADRVSNRRISRVRIKKMVEQK